MPLALRGTPFSISVAIGFIALFGVGLLTGVKKLREQGLPPLDAARQGAARLRAVVVAATVAAVGFIPMARCQVARRSARPARRGDAHMARSEGAGKLCLHYDRERTTETPASLG